MVKKNKDKKRTRHCPRSHLPPPPKVQVHMCEGAKSEKVRLKVNMVLEGKVIPCGTVIEREQLPEALRDKRYVEPSFQAKVRAYMSESAVQVASAREIEMI